MHRQVEPGVRRARVRALPARAASGRAALRREALRRRRAIPSLVAENIQYFPQTFEGALLGVRERPARLSGGVGRSVLSRLRWLDRSGREIGSLGTAGDSGQSRAFRPTGRGSPWTSWISRRETWTSGSTNLPAASRRASRRIRRSKPGRSGRPTGADRVHVASARPSGHLSDERRAAPAARRSVLDVGQSQVRDRLVAGRPVPSVSRASTRRRTSSCGRCRSGATASRIPFLQDASFGVSHGQFSPDGRWVAYASNESGEVGDRRRAVSRAGRQLEGLHGRRHRAPMAA